MSTSRSDVEQAWGPKPNSGRAANPVAPLAVLSSAAVSLFGRRKPEDEEDLSERIPPEKLDEIDPPLKASNQLAIFRRLTGIDSGATHRPSRRLGVHRPAANRGIYQHVVEEESAAKRKYLLFSRLINGCLGLQIIVAAALTALGAGDGPHAVVTVFGAINTVIAGFLTYLKGSGLPNRPKFFQTQWSELREHIEQRERDFGREDCPRNVDDEVSTVESMYKEIKAEIEANTPDGYTSVTRGKRVLHAPASKPLGSVAGSEMNSTMETRDEKDEAGRMNDRIEDR